MISQTEDTITLGNFAFPVQFLLKRKFPPLPDGMNARYYKPQDNIFWLSDGRIQQSAGSVPWEEGEAFLKQAEALFQEYQLQQQTPEKETETPSFNHNNLLFDVQTSWFYALSKGAAKKRPNVNWEFQEVKDIFSTPLVSDPRALAVDGLLHSNLLDLVNELRMNPDIKEELENAIAEFNPILKKHLKIDWEIKA